MLQPRHFFSSDQPLSCNLFCTHPSFHEEFLWHTAVLVCARFIVRSSQQTLKWLQSHSFFQSVTLVLCCPSVIDSLNCCSTFLAILGNSLCCRSMKAVISSTKTFSFKKRTHLHHFASGILKRNAKELAAPFRPREDGRAATHTSNCTCPGARSTHGKNGVAQARTGSPTRASALGQIKHQRDRSLAFFFFRRAR